MTFGEIRADYETQGGGWIFDLVLNKVKMAYGSYGSDVVEGFIRFAPLLNSFLQDQIAYEYQIREFGRDVAERQHNELLKKTEVSHFAVMDDFSEANIKKTEKILLELFDLITEKERGTQAYSDEFEVFYEGERKNRIVEADLCLKFQLELKKRLFSDTPAPVATSTDGNQSKEIYISPENIEPIYNVLAPYFRGQETELRQLLNGERIEKPLDWSKNANQLTHVFWSAKRNGFILVTNARICEWILRNFRYSNGKEFERSSVTKDLNTQETRCKKPLPNSYF